MLRKAAIIVFLACMPLLTQRAAVAQQDKLPAPFPRVLITVFEDLTFGDLESVADNPALKRAALGLMNSTTLANQYPESHYLTLGTGSRAGFPGSVARFRDIVKWNRRKRARTLPGTLGGLVDDRSYFCISSTVSERSRISSYVIADKKGSVHDSLNLPVDYSQVSDWKSLAADFLTAREAARLVLFDATKFLDAEDRRERLEAYLEASAELDAEQGQFHIILGAAPQKLFSENGSDLLPVLVFGAGFEGRLLYSKSARRPGLVLNVDMAPSVLSMLDLGAEAPMVGRPFEVMPSNAPLSELRSLYRHAMTVEKVGVSAWVLFAVAGGVFLLLTFWKLGFRAGQGKSGGAFGLRPYLAAASAMFALPPGLLLVGLWPGAPGAAMVGAPLVFMAAGAVLAPRSPRAALRRLALLSGAAAALLLFAVLSHPLNQFPDMALNSVLGPSPLRGGRFFGLNNTLAGMFVGGLSVFLIGLRDRQEGRRPGWLFIGAALLLGAIFCGAPGGAVNIGAAISMAAIALTVLLIGGWGRVTWPGAAGVAVGTAGIAAILMALDRRAGYSHLGLAMDAILRDPQNLAAFAERKLLLNLHFLNLTVWSWAAVVLYAALVWLAVSKRWIFREVERACPHSFPGFQAVLTGGLVAILVNDTGAAVILFLGLYAFGYLFAQAAAAREGEAVVDAAKRA